MIVLICSCSNFPEKTARVPLHLAGGAELAEEVLHQVILVAPEGIRDLGEVLENRGLPPVDKDAGGRDREPVLELRRLRDIGIRLLQKVFV